MFTQSARMISKTQTNKQDEKMNNLWDISTPTVLLFSRTVSVLNFWMDVEVGCALTPNWGNFSSHSKQAIVITFVLFLERIR